MTDHPHHHHGHDHGPDHHGHDRPQDHDGPEQVEEPMDAANKALSDALQVSFRILKGIMVVLLILYMVSNVKCIESHQQAVVLQMGEIKPGVKTAGLVRAWPFPFEEILILPTSKANTITIDSHNFKRRPGEEGRELSMISRDDHSGLDPVEDRALLTGDKGLVHVQWKITYKFEDVSKFVRTINRAERVSAGEVVQAAEDLIRTIVETVGIHIASEMTAEHIIRSSADVQSLMQARVNDRLRALDSGLAVAYVEMKDPTPALQVRDYFNQTQIAEQNKTRQISSAQGSAVEIKNKTAGAVYGDIIRLLDAIEAAEGAERDHRRGELSKMLLSDLLGGEAGKMISDARSYDSRVGGRMREDVLEYQKLIVEFERDPGLLISRKWEEARQAILNNPTTDKIYRPVGLGQFRLKIGRDPMQKRLDDAIKLQIKQGASSTPEPQDLLPQQLHPMGPEFD